MKYPIIFWVHSPIGFEAYLSFKTLAKNLDIELKLFLTRNMHHKDASLETNDNGLVWDQTKESQEMTWVAVGKAIDQINRDYNGYTLCLPQSGVPYIESLIESPFCQGFSYYEEGTLNYDTDETFKNKSERLCYKYDLNFGPEAIRALNIMNVSPDILSSRHSAGVTLLDFSHEKYLGAFSFFEGAFPGFEKTLIPIFDSSEQSVIEKSGILLVPNMKLLKSTSSLKDYLVSTKNIIDLRKDLDWIVKVHPNQTTEDEVKFSTWLSVRTFSEFSKSHIAIASRETAFLGYGLYVTPSNSTLHYLKLRNCNNFIVVDYPQT